ncbi:hypothetical protein [Luteolibacter marinus]|uniref:hypothetical protein n=1 Tax=Luteolibacter marinus TaxID=2776705 RepID=UPI00186625BE|nr:hypothetical protein [Luteolibacter marinus]
MPNRLSEFAHSLRQLGEVQVNDWDLMGLLNRDIKDLEIGDSLRRLGNRKVMDWDFKTAMPAVHKLAYQEVDLVSLVKRAAHYKVMEWDFRSLSDDDAAVVEPAEPEAAPKVLSDEEIEAVVERLKNFLTFVAVSLIDEADRARIKIQRINREVVRFKIVVTRNDQINLVGRNGVTAAAIRNLVKASGLAEGIHVLLQILTDDEEQALLQREGA